MGPACKQLLIWLCAVVLMATCASALTVEFSEVDYQALEGLGGRLITVVKREVNIANVSVTVVPLTFSQFLALGITVNASTDLDPAEFDQFRQDFSNATIDLVFPPSTGDVEMDLTIEYIDDDIDEPDEGFIVLAQVNTTNSVDEDNLRLIRSGIALMIITDDDMISVGFGMSSYNVQENAGTVDDLVFVIKLNDMQSERILNVLLDVSVVGTAERDVDFSIVAPINITFQPSEQQMAVVFNITDDDALEDMESFSLILSNTGSSSDFTIGGPVAQINIEDNEFLTIGFQQPVYTANEGDGVVEVCVVLIDPANIPSGFFACGTLGTAPGSAESDVDFTSISESAELAEGTLEMCFNITITDDNEIESTESFTVQLLRDAFTEDYVILSPNETTVVIQDNDNSMGGDPHYSVLLPTGQMLCFSVHGEKGFSFNLVSNSQMHMNALFIPDSRREEITWIGSLGITVRNTPNPYRKSNVTKLRFEAEEKKVYIGDKVTLLAQKVDRLTFRNGKLTISQVSRPKSAKYYMVYVDLQDVGLSFSVKFIRKHLDMTWKWVDHQPTDSHGLIGQFFRDRVEIDEARKLLLLPNKGPVPVMRRPVWHFMEREEADDKLCWEAKNPGYQGKGLIEGHYLDYLVNDVLSDDFKFQAKERDL